MRKVWNGVDGCACGLARAGRRGHAYNEEAFRYLLALERKRAERWDRPFVLLLVDLDTRRPAGVIHRMVARRVFAALWRCLRETDVVGWYREPLVAGALLTDLGEGSDGAEVGRLMSERISGVLGEILPSELARRLQVRVYRHRDLRAGEM